MEEGQNGKALENNGLLLARYRKVYQSAKDQYEQGIQRYLQSVANAGDEGHKFFGSGLVDTHHPESMMPTGYYDENALYSLASLPNFEGGHFTASQILEEARKFIESNPSAKLLMVDALGQGVIGRDIALALDPAEEKKSENQRRFHTIATTLHPSDIAQPMVEEINGDALSESVSSQLIESVRQKKSEGFSLRYSWFRPVLGLVEHERNIYVLELLYRNLRELYKETDEGGYIFLQSIMSGGIDTNLLKEVFSRYQGVGLFSVDERAISSGMVVRKIPSVPELPSLEDILAHNPDVVRRLILIAEAG